MLLPTMSTLAEIILTLGKQFKVYRKIERILKHCSLVLLTNLIAPCMNHLPVK